MGMAELTGIITATDASQRNRSLEDACSQFSLEQLVTECAKLDTFRRQSENLYERVRALFFLYAIHRFHLPARLQHTRCSTLQASNVQRPTIPFNGYEHLLQRRFEEAIDAFLAAQGREGPNEAISSALSTAYHRLAFQTLADQVRRSGRARSWAISGCSAWATPPINPCASAPNCSAPAPLMVRIRFCAKRRRFGWT